jgi:hypothetical protein
LKKVKV